MTIWLYDYMPYFSKTGCLLASPTHLFFNGLRALGEGLGFFAEDAYLQMPSQHHVLPGVAVDHGAFFSDISDKPI